MARLTTSGWWGFMDCRIKILESGGTGAETANGGGGGDGGSLAEGGGAINLSSSSGWEGWKMGTSSFTSMGSLDLEKGFSEAGGSTTWG